MQGARPVVAVAPAQSGELSGPGAQPDGTVRVDGVVRNLSIHGARDVSIALFDGAPGEDAQPIVNATVAGVQAQGTAQFSVVWTNPPRGRTVEVWAVIDPDHAIPDLYRENNRGFTRIALDQ